MIGNDTTNMIWLAVVLASAIAALVAQRAPVSTLVRSAVVWTAIIVVIVVAVSHRYELKAMMARVDQGLGISEQQVSGSTVRIRMASDGHFYAQVNVNGVARTMLVDSGATNTTISGNTARAAGIERDSPGVPIEVLGMNFLSRLGSWRVEGNTLVLEPRQDAGASSGKASSI